MVACGISRRQVALVSRTGRHLQRYNKGRRQVVGCIPYRYKYSKQSPAKDDEAKELEVLVISSQSQKGKGMLFPKGGWELDESKEEAASRETLEESGVRGIIESELGKWSFRSKSHDAYYDGYMFPLRVEEQLDFWPEKNLRQRTWVSVKEARQFVSIRG
ncbi:hypothetical protein M0R45_001598 [Rubus argutus]|uniref:Nudix hydrolase domain-containing protein n=1 Tax=Rubus argutus TaxID=59490 RepID=A0AAW1VG78_RUBAR